MAQAAGDKAAAGARSGDSSGTLSKAASGAASALQLLQPSASPPSRPTSSAASTGARAMLCPFAGSQQLRASATSSPRPGSGSRCPFAAAFAAASPAVAVDAQTTAVPHLTPRAIEAVIVDEEASPFAVDADSGDAECFTAPLPTPSRLGAHASAPSAAELVAAGATTTGSRGGSPSPPALLAATCISAPLVQMHMPVSMSEAAAAAAANVRRLASRRATGSISSGACALPEPSDLSLPGGVSEAVGCQLAGSSWNSHRSGGAGGVDSAADLIAELHAAPSSPSSRRQSLDAGTAVSRRQSLEKQVLSPRASAAASSRLRMT